MKKEVNEEQRYCRKGKEKRERKICASACGVCVRVCACECEWCIRVCVCVYLVNIFIKE